MKLTFCCLALVVGLTLQAAAESNTTNILDGVTTNASGPFTLGDTGPFNFLLVTNSGALTNTVGTIGNSNAAFGNVAIVTGPGSVWASAPTLTVGIRGASNQVSVLDGAKLISSMTLGIGSYDTSIGNRLLVSGTSSYLGADHLVLGTYSSDNTFTVEQGARASLSLLTVNSESSPVGRSRILIRDPGTLVTISSALSVSRSPANLVSVSDGATLAVRSCDLGSLPLGYANRLDVSGFNTLLVVSNGLSIGSITSNNVAVLGGSSELRVQRIDVGSGSSGNELRVGNGARVISTLIPNANASLAVGSSASGNANLVCLHDSGTIWSNSGYVLVGSAGSRNVLIISNGAAMFDTIGSFGSINTGGGAGSTNNRLVVTGAGSLLSTRFGITVGGSGSQNSLLLSEGALLNSASTDIGQNCLARDNIAFVTGAGTVWSNGQLQVGFCSTNNHLVVSNGAQVFAGLVRSSVQGGASNTITVTGPGSLLRAVGDLVIGNSGTANSLLIEDGGRVEGRNDRIGWSGGSNAATLLHPGTSWSNSSLTIGDTTPGNHLTAADGARIDSGSAMLGAGGKSSGNDVVLSDPGTVWNIGTNLMLGGLGHSNRLSVIEGANASAWNIYLGSGSLVNPTALFNSDWNHLDSRGTNSVVSASNLVVGVYGRWNRAEVRDGAQLTDHDAVLGLSRGSRSNSVLVTGSGSVWANVGNLLVGSDGTRSELVIAQGGRMTDDTGYIGFSGELVGEGSSCITREGGNKAIVTDPGSFWENTNRLYVGYGSIGNTLVISNGGGVSAASLIVGNTNGIEPGSSCGPITNANRLVVDGGCLLVTNARFGSVLNVRHGTLTLNRGRIETGEFRLLNGSAGRMEFRGGTFRTFDSLVRNGLPFEVGDGLHRAVFYVDSFDSGFEILNINPHGVLRAGNALNSTTVTNAGTIVPGGSRSLSLYIEGPFTQLPGGDLSFDIGGRAQGSNYAFLVCRSTARLGGSLRLNLRDGFVPTPGDLFEIVRGATLIGTCTNAPHGARLKTLDNLGSFLVSYSSTNIVLSDYQSTDLDGDGIEDAWAVDHFGHAPLTLAEKLADADGDGMSNYDEFRAGTDPNDPASALKLSIAYAGGATVSFPSVDGKEYRVWSSTALDTWTEVSDPTFAYPAPGRCEWTDDGKDTGGLGGVSRFYRVTVD